MYYHVKGNNSLTLAFVCSGLVRSVLMLSFSDFTLRILSAPKMDAENWKVYGTAFAGTDVTEEGLGAPLSEIDND
jgi:hypothetical protein